ncbi:ABC transporter substrate-binding protein [Bradyrhizobium sp. AUGA SZCCT0431]|uniref:ABC transporter substrate-binding protein n=1 Tax=Bradyrhizobium sp. AUGA SZCCT0431 TaxID=2807674 RepID=UPI001BA45A1C|nr:ABC transporter substrate-binding protein [Bradyrhizobium sp. AUGA SZCCT0431]MBR1146177.1 ABC transporter substrate-binding protein [Bradyrhizobium sp. AUGA SZCCT0431]
MTGIRTGVAATVLFGFAIVGSQSYAGGTYDPGATDAEIKIGQTMPYSGPASSYGVIGKSQEAYFKKLNAAGGINGRKIVFLSQDDGLQPPRALEVSRKLVERDEVLFLFGSLGTATNTAVHQYANQNKIPQVLIDTGAAKFNNPAKYPWTIPYLPSYETEGEIFGKYILQEKPNAKVGILYQNDDSGKDALRGLARSLEAAGKTVAMKQTYEVTDATLDSQIIALKGAGVDAFFFFGLPKFSAQMIRKKHDIGWEPLTLISSVASSVATALEPAGLDKSIGLVTADFLKDPTDKAWANDPDVVEWTAFMNKWYPGNLTDVNSVHGYIMAKLLEQILTQCGDNLTRENVMKQAANLKELRVPMLLPGIVVNTSSTDYGVIEQVRLSRFDGKNWVGFGDVIGR